jgi:hypothetical protein
MIGDFIENFFANAPDACGSIYNERSLQLELAYAFRVAGFGVKFECPIKVARPNGSMKKPKYNLDLLISRDGQSAAVELKVPFNGRHPETMYDFCADIEFVEAILSAGKADHGYCLMATNDKAFWDDSGRGSEIHELFRKPGSVLNGVVHKPTGKGSDTEAVVVSGSYLCADMWRQIQGNRLITNARYLLIEVTQ